jgi:UDP-glucose 4-epimerase
MNIMVTGAAGFIGSYIVDELIDRNHTVYAVDDLSGGYRENVNPQAIFCKIDLRNKKAIKELIEQVKPEIIYHLAADATEGRSQFTPLECTERNYLAYMNLLVPAIRNGMQKMVLFSSMSVYGAQKPPFDEDMHPEPEDIYGISKYAMEQATKILGEVHGFKWTIIRPHNVYGPRQNMADPYRNVIAIFMNKILHNEPFYIYGDGNQKRAFSYIEDSVVGMVEAGFMENTDSQIINIGPDKEYTINELAENILKIAGAEHLKPKYLPSRPKEVKNAWCTNKKAKHLLGYKDSISLQEGLKKMWDWAKEKGLVDFKYLKSLELDSKDTPETWRNKLI